MQRFCFTLWEAYTGVPVTWLQYVVCTYMRGHSERLGMSINLPLLKWWAVQQIMDGG